MGRERKRTATGSDRQGTKRRALAAWPAAGGLLSRHGFPVLVQTLTAGNLEVEETVSVARVALGDAPFRVPAGFKKRELPGGP